MSKKKKIILTGGIAVLAIAGVIGLRAYSRQKAMKTMRESMGQVETVRVTRQNLIDSISVTGTIASADAWDVSASAKDVEVLEVNCEVGDYVNEGDVIVVLDTTDLELSLTEAQNKQVLSEYNESKSIESATENYTEAVEDGTDTYQKAVESEADAKEALMEASQDVESAADKLLRQEERLGEAKAAFEAATPVEKPANYDQLKLADPDNAEVKAYDDYLALEQAVTSAQQEYTSRHQAYVAAAEAEEKAQETYEKAVEALEDAQKNNNKNISNAADQLEKAQMEQQYSNDSNQEVIENYQKQIDSCTVTAPISGVITAMNVAVGDTYMGEGSNLFSIADKEYFVVSASVDEYDISSISRNMEAAVIVEAISEEELPATVSFVSPTATSSMMGGSSYELEIALNDPNENLRIGMTAKASIVLDAAYDVLTVPYDCVETDVNGKSVVYIDQNGEKTALEVEVGMQGDYYVEVSGEGLDENSVVYYATPMTVNAGSDSEEDAQMMMGMPMGGGVPGERPSGGMPNGGGNRGGGGMPAGGGPGGF